LGEQTLPYMRPSTAARTSASWSELASSPVRVYAVERATATRKRVDGRDSGYP
jgi:hypothetical protein